MYCKSIVEETSQINHPIASKKSGGRTARQTCVWLGGRIILYEALFMHGKLECLVASIGEMWHAPKFEWSGVVLVTC